MEEHDAEASREEAQAAALHVLGFFNLPGGHAPGGFTTRLIALFQHADPANKARLRRAFPAIASAMALIDSNDIETLAQQARGK